MVVVVVVEAAAPTATVGCSWVPASTPPPTATSTLLSALAGMKGALLQLRVTRSHDLACYYPRWDLRRRPHPHTRRRCTAVAAAARSAIRGSSLSHHPYLPSVAAMNLLPGVTRQGRAGCLSQPLR